MNQLQQWYYRQPPALRVILLVNVVLYVTVQFLYALWPPGLRFIADHLALHPTFPDILFEPWQLITYNFLHLGGGFGGLLHIAFNMLWLFWIGKEYERMHGTSRVWTVYLGTGVIGGLMCLLLAPVMPSIASGYVHGASASVLGVIMAVAILYPYKQIGLLFIGVVRLLYVVIGFLVIDALLALSSSGVAVAAHWGGALGGYLFAKQERGGIGLPSWLTGWFGGSESSSRSSRSRRASSGEDLGLLDRLEMWLGGSVDTSGNAGSSIANESASNDGRGPTREPRQTDIEKEVDRILDKISEKGYDALSDEEKETLEEASRS